MVTKLMVYPSTSSDRSSATPKFFTFVALCLETFGMAQSSLELADAALTRGT